MSSPAPAKSQQLHNFSLPELRWNKNNNNNNLHQRRRRATDSPPLRHQSPIRDSDSDQKKDDPVEKSEKDSKAKILIRFSRKSGKVAESADEKNESPDQVPKKDEIQAEKEVDVENGENDEVEEPKLWNLRPRRAGKKAMNVDNTGTIKAQENKTRIRTDIIGGSNSNANKKENKPKFSISLTREEIEEDMLIMTGSKPSRKPKRRTKTVQRQLDCVFPGLYLSSVTPDSYKVSDPSSKK
ncbi:uncharacterized protein LOC141724204 [Apium graveolens]|uniref:uncharacterized protein LOC141724204 n=1 Tax=Apium graveolens TaxID=4045 RepID=UPI003D7AD47F